MNEKKTVGQRIDELWNGFKRGKLTPPEYMEMLHLIGIIRGFITEALDHPERRKILAELVTNLDEEQDFQDSWEAMMAEKSNTRNKAGEDT